MTVKAGAEQSNDDAPSSWRTRRVGVRGRLVGAGVVLALIAAALLASAGPLENAVDRIETAVGNITKQVNGLKPMIERVTQFKDNLDPATITDLSNRVAQLKPLLTFLRERRAQDGDSNQYVDLASLVASLKDLMNAVGAENADSPRLELGILEDVLQSDVIPERLLAAAGRTLSAVGINRSTPARLQEVVAHVQVLHDALTASEAQQRSAALPNATARLAASQDLPAATNCGVINERGVALSQSVSYLTAYGRSFTLAAKIMDATSETVVQGVFPGVHGYATLSVEVSPEETIAKIYDTLGESILRLAESVDAKQKHCELLHGQKQADQKLAAAQAQISALANRANAILNEVCNIERSRTELCMAFQREYAR